MLNNRLLKMRSSKIFMPLVNKSWVWLVLIIQMVNFSFVTGTDAPESKEVEIKWGIKIPLRDGVKVNATIYQQRGLTDKLPVILCLTPYNADTYQKFAWYYAQNGYIFAVVDVRGRGNSEGEFNPMLQEANDGHDIVEWLGKQEWSDGQVAMWGGSYGGYDQWATAKEFPSHLKTIVPVASCFMGVDVPIRGNITSPYWIQWMTLTSDKIANFNLFGEKEYWSSVYFQMYKNHLPYADLPKLANNSTTQFNVWMDNPEQGEFWDSYNPTDKDFKKFKMPILTITGHYDGDQPGAMEYYHQHMKLGSAKGRQNHFLIIGPWDHGGTRVPKRKVGGLDFGEESLLDIKNVHKEWYDWTMKDGQKPEFLKKQIAYYVLGSNKWKYIDSLKELDYSRKKLYLNSDGNATSVFNSGSLKSDLNYKNSKDSDTYIYNPLNTKPGEIELETVVGSGYRSGDGYIIDQSFAMSIDGNGLVYHSEPFESDTEISGYVKFVAWLAMNVTDTDFIISLYEILPNGNSILLTDDQLRARYRKSLRKAEMVKPGKILKYEFDGFMFFSKQIQKDSRLRLVLKSINSINSQKNYNSGGVVALESGKDAKTANVTLYHSKKYSTYLELPIIK
jgi:putative CocE/NonD family hydrolase|tara:strand:+ start:4481 stop:6331 length:1851 start_codon:yes stop_codon:yes gene_type:complete